MIHVFLYCRSAINSIMTMNSLNPFLPVEIAFLKEWAQVMGIVAKALDFLQGEQTAYLGTLLPTVVMTIMKLENSKAKKLVHCNSLVDAVLEGIHNRFGHLLEDLGCQLASAFHPRFRLHWLQKYLASVPQADNDDEGAESSKLLRVRHAMEKAVTKALEDQDSASSSSSDGGNEGEEEAMVEDTGDFFADFSLPAATGSSSNR